MKKTFKQKTAQIWGEHKLTIIPVTILALFLAGLYGTYVGLDKYRTKQAEKSRQEKLLNSLNAAKQAQDTIVMDTVKQNVKK